VGARRLETRPHVKRNFDVSPDALQLALQILAGLPAERLAALVEANRVQ
jgi:hypothetical protein